MNKRFILTTICIIILFTTTIYAADNLEINAKSAILMDYNTGEIIYEKKSHDRLPPASISKIMTLLLGMEALESGKISLDDEVRISSHASRMGGSQLWLEEGEIQTVEDLFKAICLRSANDASVALAEYIAGSEMTFVKMMNDKAKELGMDNSNFTNATGLPHEDNYVSAYDVAKMSRELLKHKKNTRLVNHIYGWNKGREKKDKIQSLVNTNRLIIDYEGTTGIKTGSTNEAGFCLSASAKRGGNLQLIAVVMGCETSKIRFEESIRLLDYGFANYDSIPIGKKNEVMAKVLVHKGKDEYIEAVLEKDGYILVPKGKDTNISKEIILPEFIESPVEQGGEEIGYLIVNLDGKEVDKIRLITKHSIEKANLTEMFKKKY